MKQTLSDLAKKLGCRLVGDGSVTVTAVSSLQSASKESLVFVEDEDYLAQAKSSSAAAIIAGEFAKPAFKAATERKSERETKKGVSKTIAKSVIAKPMLISPHPRLTFARAERLLECVETHRAIHPTAIVAPSAKLGKNIAIGAAAIIGERASIGEGTTIGAACVIGDHTGSTASDAVTIGKHCCLDPNVTIYSGTILGNRVIVQAGAVLGSAGFGYVKDSETGRYERAPQIGRLVIEDDVEIGANCTIDRGALDETRIRRGAKIDNLVHIGHNCQIGENVIMAAQIGLSGSVIIEDNVIMGGQVGIGDHARIEAGTMLGGQAGVLPKKVLRGKGVVFWGTPARPVREYLKVQAFLARAAKKDKSTPELRERAKQRASK
jgi:UDP-3-O-[3-hydroxymyristoyl] glucosamine N-acyltransferase